MEDFLLYDFFIKLFYAVVTLGLFWIVLRFRDKLAGVNFKKDFERVKNDGLSFAVYLTGTAVAVSIIISGFF